jgi:hypothetical protein
VVALGSLADVKSEFARAGPDLRSDVARRSSRRSVEVLELLGARDLAQQGRPRVRPARVTFDHAETAVRI